MPYNKTLLKKKREKNTQHKIEKTEHITLAQESNTGFTMAVTSVITSE